MRLTTVGMVVSFEAGNAQDFDCLGLGNHLGLCDTQALEKLGVLDGKLNHLRTQITPHVSSAAYACNFHAPPEVELYSMFPTCELDSMQS